MARRHEASMFDDTLFNPWLWLIAAGLVVFAMRAEARELAAASKVLPVCKALALDRAPSAAAKAPD